MKRAVLLSLLALLLALTFSAAPSEAVFCHRNVYCLDVWKPVICDNGVVYSNDCYAYRACATGCVPYGMTM